MGAGLAFRLFVCSWSGDVVARMVLPGRRCALRHVVCGRGLDHSFGDGFVVFPDDGFFVSNPNDFDGTDGVGQEFSERRIESGSASPSFSFSNTGDNVNACPTTQQVVNTGNVANEQGVVQYASEADDISFEGSSIIIEPSLTSDCTQTLDQAAAV